MGFASLPKHGIDVAEVFFPSVLLGKPDIYIHLSGSFGFEDVLFSIR